MVGWGVGGGWGWRRGEEEREGEGKVGRGGGAKINGGRVRLKDSIDRYNTHADKDVTSTMHRI